MHGFDACSQGGFYETVKLLIDRGADVNAEDNKGRTALCFALNSGDCKTVNLLIDRGAQLDILAGGALLVHSYKLLIDGAKGIWARSGSYIGAVLNPGIRTISVYYSDRCWYGNWWGDGISFSLNVKSGAIYFIRYKVYEETRKWTAWVERCR